MARAIARGSPRKIAPIHSPNAGWLCVSVMAIQQTASNHEALDLAGSFPNGAKPRVAVKLFNGIVLEETVAAVNLQGLAAHAHGGLRRKQLRHGGFARHGVALVLQPGSLIGEQARCLDLGSH